jgi:hypothetical protein
MPVNLLRTTVPTDTAKRQIPKFQIAAGGSQQDADAFPGIAEFATRKLADANPSNS